MKILIFTEGTILMHKAGLGCSREERVKHVHEDEGSIGEYQNYVPIGDAVSKINEWKNTGAEICYLTSRTKKEEIEMIQDVLDMHQFPKGEVFFRKPGEEYKDVAERLLPDVLVEDDCESIGGEGEMTITHVDSEIKKKIRSLPVKEFGGIDHVLLKDFILPIL